MGPIDTKAVRKTAWEFDHTSKSCRTYGRRYAELWRMFRSGLNFTQMGSALGVSRQAAHQLYEHWFSEYLGTVSDRIARLRRIQHAIQREAQLKQQHERARSQPVFLLLSAEAAKHGKELEPVVAYEGLVVKHGPVPVYRSQDKYIRVYVRKRTFRPNRTSPQLYATFQVTKSMLVGVHVCFLLVAIPDRERELFIVRSKLLREIMEEDEKEKCTFYIPVGNWKTRPRQVRTDLRKFKDAWWILDL